MLKSPVKDKTWRCVPAVVVYDSGACTKEEDDPARAVLYFRPRHTPTTARTSLAGQLAGVVHFCRHAFATPTIVRTRHAHVALKDYGRFVLMVCGRGGEWARSRLTEVTRLLDASTGGLPHLWATCGRDQQTFASRLTEVLDALLPQAIPDADFRDEVSHVSPSSSDAPSTPSPAAEAAETVSEEGPDSNQKEEGKDEEAFSLLHQIFNAVPSVQLPKSGGGVFLRAQQVVEACQQHPGVLAGSTMHKDRHHYKSSDTLATYLEKNRSLGDTVSLYLSGLMPSDWGLSGKSYGSFEYLNNLFNLSFTTSHSPQLSMEADF